MAFFTRRDVLVVHCPSERLRTLLDRLLAKKPLEKYRGRHCRIGVVVEPHGPCTSLLVITSSVKRSHWEVFFGSLFFLIGISLFGFLLWYSTRLAVFKPSVFTILNATFFWANGYWFGKRLYLRPLLRLRKLRNRRTADLLGDLRRCVEAEGIAMDLPGFGGKS